MVYKTVKILLSCFIFEGQIMTMTIIIVASIFTAFEFLSVIGKMSTSLLKKVLGYEYVVDIFMSFGLMIYFGLTGSVTGIIVSAVSGFIFSVALYAAKHIIGYKKLERVPGTWFKFRWVEYPGDWSSEKAGGFFSRMIGSIGKFITNFFGGFRKAKSLEA